MTSFPREILDDPARLSALKLLDLLDTPAEEAFDRLTRMAARILKTPISIVSLVDRDRQFFKSHQDCLNRGAIGGRHHCHIHSVNTRLPVVSHS